MASQLPTLYVDEKKGSDTAAKGTQDSPFATPVAAYLSLNLTADKDPLSVCQILAAKTTEDGKTEWAELSGAGKKKLVKGIDAQRKKAAKAAADGERLAKEAAENEARQSALRAEAAKIKLEEDTSKGEASKVSREILGVGSHHTFGARAGARGDGALALAHAASRASGLGMVEWLQWCGGGKTRCGGRRPRRAEATRRPRPMLESNNLASVI